jgi:hypothetical protein
MKDFYLIKTNDVTEALVFTEEKAKSIMSNCEPETTIEKKPFEEWNKWEKEFLEQE